MKPAALLLWARSTATICVILALAATTHSVFAAPASGHAPTTPYTFRYEHKYKTWAKTHIDKLGISRDIGSGFSVGLFEEFLPAGRADGSAGHAFQSLEAYKTRAELKYSRKLSERISLKPRLRVDSKDSKTEVSARIQVQFQLADRFSLAPSYERKYARAKHGGANRNLDQLALAFAYRWDAIKIKYTRKQMYADRVLADHHQHDYKNQLSVTYLDGSWQPYVEVRDASRSSSVPGRQADIRAGFKYRF